MRMKLLSNRNKHSPFILSHSYYNSRDYTDCILAMRIIGERLAIHMTKMIIKYLSEHRTAFSFETSR